MAIKFRLILAILILQFSLLASGAQENTFPQKIQWKSNANALEYKVEVQDLEKGRTQIITTDKNSTELSLAPGAYRYRVRAFDYLGKEASVSAWINFDVYKAAKPRISMVEEKVKVSSEGNSINLNVDISAVNKNSKFELVNESLEGSIDASEKIKMKDSSSETERVTSLDFNNVPPGIWRLRVTNASGLTSISEPIVVEGERLYTAEEVAAITAEAELAKELTLKKEFEANIDQYVKEVEAKKTAEKERIAKEKEAEKERIAKEKKAEEERIAQEKAAEEKRKKEAAEQAKKEAAEKKRLAKLARKNQPYIWKEIIIEGGGGIALNLYDASIKDYYEKSWASAVKASIKYMPFRFTANRLGYEFAYSWQNYSVNTDYYTSTLNSHLFDVKFVWQYKLMDSLFLSAKGGLGLDVMRKTLDYTELASSNRSSPGVKSYFYTAFVAGVSVFYNPWKFVVVEAGVDFSHVIAASTGLGFFTPYVCAGFRF